MNRMRPAETANGRALHCGQHLLESGLLDHHGQQGLATGAAASSHHLHTARECRPHASKPPHMLEDGGLLTTIFQRRLVMSGCF